MNISQGRAVKLTLTVKRPNGEIEQVVHPTLKFITDVQFKQIQRNTKAAGRGDVLSYEIEREAVDNSALEEHRRKARAYDDLYNEGNEGYNPYR